MSPVNEVPLCFGTLKKEQKFVHCDSGRLTLTLELGGSFTATASINILYPNINRPSKYSSSLVSLQNNQVDASNLILTYFHFIAWN